MKRGVLRFMVGIAVGFFSLSACMRVVFLKTDDRFVPKKSGKDPEYYVDRLPVRPYRSVGIIEVSAQGQDVIEIVKAAAEKAQEIGCDLIVARAIHRVSNLDGFGVIAVIPEGAVVPIQYQAPIVVPQQPSTRFEFICGVFVGDSGKPGV